MSASATAHLFRLYAGDELGDDGYPPIWHLRLKHQVREETGNRCCRCGHPYSRGEHPMERVELEPGQVSFVSWSPCDERCVHRGKVRIREAAFGEDSIWREVDLDEVGCSAGESRMDEDPLGPFVRYDVEGRFRILTVHHLDGNKANCRWWNLAPLCQACHLRVQRRVVMERVWPWEHSTWFHPYVAGYYAFVYLDEDLSRSEVEDRLEELLALERMV